MRKKVFVVHVTFLLMKLVSDACASILTKVNTQENSRKIIHRQKLTSVVSCVCSCSLKPECRYSSVATDHISGEKECLHFGEVAAVNEAIAHDRQITTFEIMPETCSAALKRNDGLTGNYLIMIRTSEGNKFVLVECYLDSAKQPSFRFAHALPPKYHFTGHENEPQILRIPYNVDLADIAYFVQRAKYCKQTIRLECDNVSCQYQNVCYLMDRNSERFGFREAPCNCQQIANECTHAGLSDTYGYIDDRSALPVTTVAIADTGSSSEYAYMYLGDVTCAE